jgi:hypothetical protein
MNNRELNLFATLKLRYDTAVNRYRNDETNASAANVNRTNQNIKNFLRNISKKYHIPSNNRQWRANLPTLKFVLESLRAYNRRIGKGKTPAKTPGKRARPY